MRLTVRIQTAKTLDKSKNDPDVLAGEYPMASVHTYLNKVIEVGTATTNDTPFKAKRSENMKVAQSSSLLDICTDLQARKQTKILSRVKSAKDNFTRLFKTTGRVSPTISNFSPFAIPNVQRHCVQDVHPSPLLLTSMPQGVISGVRVVTVFDPLPRLETITSFVAYSEHVVEKHAEDFVSISQGTEASSPSSPAQLVTAPECQLTPPATFLLNELHTIEEEAEYPEVDPEGVHMEPKTLTASSSCGPLTTSDSEVKYDAILAAEFATFSFDSNDIQEWSDEVEKKQQAKMDAHFAYVSEALMVPVPKLSAYFSTDSPADFMIIDKDKFISDPSPIKTETSETNTSSADSSLVTSVDVEESLPHFSPPLLRGLRRVKNYEDLRNLEVMSNCSNSLSDLSRWSFDLGLSHSIAAGSKTGALRRSVKCNDLRKSFLLREPEACPPNREATVLSSSWSSWYLGDPTHSPGGLAAHRRGVHFLM